MHDEMFERRMRAALHGEADAMPFTITAAELERRFALRRRRGVSRTATLLVAAGIGVGIVGAAGAAAGWFDRSTLPPGPAPSTAPAIVGEASPPPSPSHRASAAPPALPTLDALIAAGDPSTVVLAQAHGPDVGPDRLPVSVAVDPPNVELALPPDHGTYEVSFACISSGQMGYFVKDPARFGVLVMPDTPCDGSITTKTFRDQGTLLDLVAEAPQASWRVVVRRLSAPPGPIDGVTEPPVDPGQEEFARTTDQDVGGNRSTGSATPGASAVPVRIVSLPARRGYNLSVSCSGAPLMRIIFGDDSTDQPVADTDSQVFCDGSVHRHKLTIAHPNGTGVYVTPMAGMTWQLVVSSDAPPIQLIDREPGWQLSTGLGPSFRFDGAAQSLSLYAHEKRGPVRVAVTCAGNGIGIAHVTVQNGAPSTAPKSSFDVDCPASGGHAAQTYDVPGGNVDLTYQLPPRSWIAVSALVPDPATAP
jgi:hypothetical protein